MTLSCFSSNDTATTEIYPLSLHDALPIYDVPLDLKLDPSMPAGEPAAVETQRRDSRLKPVSPAVPSRSEEHTSELQSQSNLVCRLLLEKKNHATRSAACSCADSLCVGSLR